MAFPYENGSAAKEAFLEGKALMAQRSWTAAGLAMFRAIRAQPDIRNAWDILAHALFLKRKHRSEAVVRLRIAREFGHQGPIAAANHHRLATQCFRNGDVAAAIGWMQLSYLGDDTNPRWTRELVWLLERLDPFLDGGAIRTNLTDLRPMTEVEARLVEVRLAARHDAFRRLNPPPKPSGQLPPVPRRPRVAILISGQLRDFEARLPGIRDYLAAPLRADVFLDSWAKQGLPRLSRLFAPDLQRALVKAGLPIDETLAARFPIVGRAQGVARPEPRVVAKAARACRVRLEDEPESLGLSRSIAGVTFPPKWSGYSVGSLPMFYKIKTCFTMMEEHEQATGITYDVVVRVRPDLSFPDRFSVNFASDVMKPNVVYLGGLDVGNFDDQFAIGTRDAMARYCSAFDRLPDYWMQRGEVPGATLALGEQLLFQHLFYEGVVVERIPWLRRPSLSARTVSLAEMVRLLDVASREAGRDDSVVELLAALKHKSGPGTEPAWTVGGGQGSAAHP